MNLNRILYALSFFSDRSNGYDTFHQRRVALIAYNIAKQMGFDEYGLNLILEAALIHDAALLSEATKTETFRQIINENFEQLNRHAAIGKRAARFFSLHLDVSNAVNLHHTPSNINPAMLGNILFLSDNIEVSYRSLSNPFAFDELYDFLSQKKELFHDEAFKAYKELSQKESFWYQLHEKNLDSELSAVVNKLYEPVKKEDFIKRIAYFMAYSTDNLSPFFENYSVLSKNIAISIGYKLSLDMERIVLSTLLSHLGNVFLPTELLNNPGSLSSVDFNIIKSHPYYSKKIIDIMGLEDEIKFPAIYHHEVGTDSAYPFIVGDVDEYAQVVGISTACAALLQDRPYRIAYDADEAKDIIKNMNFEKRVVDITLNLDFEKIKNIKDNYYEGVRRLFV